MEALGTARMAQGQKIRAVEQLLRRVREALGRAPGAEARVRRRSAAEEYSLNLANSLDFLQIWQIMSLERRKSVQIV